MNKFDYENYNRIRTSKGFNDTQVSKGTGVPRAVFSDWKAKRSTPKTDKLLSIASFLGVSLEALQGNSERKAQTESDYYFDEYARELVDFLKDNPDYKVLFDASRKIKSDDIEFVKKMIEKMGDADDGC